jgi:sugar/nucleoside kinase (ribokinase family)
MAVIFTTPYSKRMVIAGGANVYFDPAAVDSEIFAPGVHLHVVTAMCRIALPLIRLAKERGATVSCDLDIGSRCVDDAIAGLGIHGSQRLAPLAGLQRWATRHGDIWRPRPC